jgi:hypothetical protein
VRDFAKLVGGNPGYVSHVLQGKRGPPDDVEEWATKLGLEGDEREAFLLAASLARAHPRVAARIKALEGQVDELGQKGKRTGGVKRKKGRGK